MRFYTQQHPFYCGIDLQVAPPLTVVTSTSVALGVVGLVRDARAAWVEPSTAAGQETTATPGRSSHDP